MLTQIQEAQPFSAQKYWLCRILNAAKLIQKNCIRLHTKQSNLFWSLIRSAFVAALKVKCRCLQTADLFFNVIQRCCISMRVKLSRLFLTVFNSPILYLTLMFPLNNQNMTEKKRNKTNSAYIQFKKTWKQTDYFCGSWNLLWSKLLSGVLFCYNESKSTWKYMKTKAGLKSHFYIKKQMSVLLFLLKKLAHWLTSPISKFPKSMLKFQKKSFSSLYFKVSVCVFKVNVSLCVSVSECTCRVLGALRAWCSLSNSDKQANSKQ